MTRAPRLWQRRHAATPLLPSPTTITRCPSSSITLPELHGGERHEREQDGDDPEPDDDARLGPALLLVVVVDRRHQEDALLEQLEGDHLGDDARGLDRKDAAEDDAQKLGFGDDGAHAEPAA